MTNCRLAEHSVLGSGEQWRAACVQQCDLMNEDERQAFHLALGILLIAMVAILGVGLSAYVVSVSLIVGLVLVHIKLTYIHLDRRIGKYDHDHPNDGIGFVNLLNRNINNPGVSIGFNLNIG